MRDPTSLVFALGLLLTAGSLVLLLRRFARTKTEEPPEVLKKLYAVKGPRCRYCGDPATHRPFRWVRDQGAADLLRRMFGAPGRVRVGRDHWGEPVACEVHDALVAEQFRIELGRYEVARAELEATWELRRARFQREGVHELVKDRIEAHDAHARKERAR